MNHGDQSHCRILRTGIVQAMDSAFVHVDVEGKRIAVPMNKCETSIRIGNAVAWNGRQWAKWDKDVQS